MDACFEPGEVLFLECKEYELDCFHDEIQFLREKYENIGPVTQLVA